MLEKTNRNRFHNFFKYVSLLCNFTGQLYLFYFQPWHILKRNPVNNLFWQWVLLFLAYNSLHLRKRSSVFVSGNNCRINQIRLLRILKRLNLHSDYSYYAYMSNKFRFKACSLHFYVIALLSTPFSPKLECLPLNLSRKGNDPRSS